MKIRKLKYTDFIYGTLNSTTFTLESFDFSFSNGVQGKGISKIKVRACA